MTNHLINYGNNDMSNIRSKTEDLEILLAVADQGGFSAAANVLDIQVAKVSRAVARLELQHGCSLFTRTTRKVTPTQEGEHFVAAIRQAMDNIAQAEQVLSEQQHRPQGRLRVDAASPFVLHQLVPLVEPFRELYPDIELQLVSNESFIDLIEKRTDLAIRIGALGDSGLHATPLGRSPLYLLASPMYLQKYGKPTNLDALSAHEFIGFSDTPLLNKLPSTPPILLRPNISASSGETIRQLCLAGNGIALLSNFMTREDIESGRLIRLLPELIESPNGREQVQAVYYKHSPLATRIDVFLSFIKSRLTL